VFTNSLGDLILRAAM